MDTTEAEIDIVKWMERVGDMNISMHIMFNIIDCVCVKYLNNDRLTEAEKERDKAMILNEIMDLHYNIDRKTSEVN